LLDYSDPRGDRESAFPSDKAFIHASRLKRDIDLVDLPFSYRVGVAPEDTVSMNPQGYSFFMGKKVNEGPRIIPTQLNTKVVSNLAKPSSPPFHVAPDSVYCMQ
jgi:hypothetical protein